MPGAKVRGKSAILIHDNVQSASPALATTNGATQQHNNSNNPLKIESVVPTSNSRAIIQINGSSTGTNHAATKLFRRSNSTLTSAYYQKTMQLNARNVNRMNHDVIDENSSTYSSNSSTSSLHIKRTPKEKEKLPDRINLDRRGLTSIPYIEDEVNLRLLSLQHNLINTFQVPSEKDKKSQYHNTTQPQPAAPPPSTTMLTTTQSTITNVAVASTVQMNGNRIHGSLMVNSNCNSSKSAALLKRSNSFINSNSAYLTSNKIGYDNKKNRLNHMMSFNMADGSSPGCIASTTTTAVTGKSDKISSLTIPCNTPPPYTQLGFSISLQNLVFLDLYDNQIDKISNLDGLRNLTVLLLGKNRITDITGIVSLKATLRVLDLHGNKIASITNRISQLLELKSLNLAGNVLRAIGANDFTGMFCLKELNLKRNRIKKLNGFEDLRNLERLWLCHNDLQKIDDMACVAKAINLKEITIENNPISLGGDCISFLVSYLPNLMLLSQMQVNEHVKRAAMAWRKNKEISDSNYLNLSSDVCHSIRREEVISNARTSWELLRSQQIKTNQKVQQTNGTVNGGSHVDLELASNLSENLLLTTSKKVTRKTAMISKDNKKVTRSSSHDTSNNINAVDESCVSAAGGDTNSNGSLPKADPVNDDELFRLPPILAPFLDKTLSQENKSNNSQGSSLGPNLDSGSSCYGSDNDDPKLKIETNAEVATVATPSPPPPPVVSVTPSPPPPPVIESKIVENSEIGEKKVMPVENEVVKSNTPDREKKQPAAAKTNNESPSPGNTEDAPPAKSTTKIKSANPNRRYYGGSLVRAQTARTSAFSSTVIAPAHNTQSNTAVLVANSSGSSTNIPKKTTGVNDREREQGGDYLIEICGRYLNVYGIGAIKFVDKQWNVQKANDVHTVKFSYINFNNIAVILYRIKVRFPNAENYVFRETNITNIGQLNALAEIQGIHSLVIDSEGNPICTKDWRHYAIYRLSHWGLKQINGVDITDEEIQVAEQMYVGLSDLVVWSLPDALLQPLLTRLRLDENCLASKMTAKEWLLKSEPSLKCVVGKEALQWKKSITAQDEVNSRQKGKAQLTSMLENTCNAVEKLQRLEILWSPMLVEMIRNTLLDYSQIDAYVKNLKEDILFK